MFLSPFQVVGQLPLTAASRVADFGSGSGQHAFLISERLKNEGAVYALDFNEESVESIARMGVRKNAHNLFSLRADFNERIPLRDTLLNSALLSNTLHAIKEREHFLKELNRTLVRGGKVLFVDWAHSFKNMGPREDQVVYPSDAVRLFERNGFSVGNMLPAGTHHFAFIASKS